MTQDVLLTDDLVELLHLFPNDALRGVVGILKMHKTWWPGEVPRAYEVHDLPDDADFKPHARAIAGEILWWGSHDLARQLGRTPTYREVVAETARSMGVDERDRQPDQPAWRVEAAILRKALKDWENLPAEKRENVIEEIGGTVEPLRGALLAVPGAGVTAAQLLGFIAARGLPFALGGAVLAPVVTAVAALWTIFELAGPGYRVLRPVVATIALTRRRLRDERAARAFRD